MSLHKSAYFATCRKCNVCINFWILVYATRHYIDKNQHQMCSQTEKKNRSHDFPICNGFQTQRFWPFYERWFQRHLAKCMCKFWVSSLNFISGSSLCHWLRLILLCPNPQLMEPDLKLRLWGYCWNCLEKLVYNGNAVSDPSISEFSIHHGSESCGIRS